MPDAGSVDTDSFAIDPSLTPEDLVLKPHPDETLPTLPDGVRVKVLTLNIYSSKLSSPEIIGAFLKDQSADVVGLQECPPDQLPAIAQAAGYPYYDGSGQCALSKTEMLDYSMLSGSSGRELVHYSTVIGGVTFSVYNVHTSWNVDGNLECKALSREVLAADPNPYKILTGDFNDEELSPQIEYLDEQVADVFTKSGYFPGERISWPSTTFDDTEGSQLIDLVFVPRGDLAIVLDAAPVNVAPVLSDHKPVVAEVLFQKDVQNPVVDPLAERHSVWRELPPEAERPVNLLSNPGAEDGANGWTMENGAVAVDAREHVTPRTGTKFFTGFEKFDGASVRVSTGSQIVDLATHAADIDDRRGRLYAAAYITTGYQLEERDGEVSNVPKPYDEGEVVVEALDGEGSVLATRYSKRRDTVQWFPFAGAMDLPPGTRSARFSFVSHYKEKNGTGNDAAFDDLYLGYATLDLPHALLGTNLLSNPGAETGTTDGWRGHTWQALPDGLVYGLAIFPPASFSGGSFFYAGGWLGIEKGPAGSSTFEQEIPLVDWGKEIATGTLALRWGGWLRTWNAANTVTMSIELYDFDGTLWGTISGDPIHDPEWTLVEQLTRIPAGASAVKVVISSDVEAQWSAAFADALFAVPERVGPAE